MGVERKLSLSEIKKIQIEMLVEMDNFCRKHGITYFLSYGTLLGAIRHKGYIPWDDDIDIMMPRADIEKLKKMYKSDKYDIVDSDSEVLYDLAYPRMIAKNTFRKLGRFNRTYGVFIDIYSIDGIQEDASAQKKHVEAISKLIRKKELLRKIMQKWMRYLPIIRLPYLKRSIDEIQRRYKSIQYDSSEYVIVSVKMILRKSVFDHSVNVDFEGYKLCAPVGWDEFLTSSYGDYMVLPSESERHPYHMTGSYYIMQDE